MSTVTGSINLAALKYVLMEKTGKEGKPVKGLFIPIEANRLQEHEKGGIFLNIVAFEMKEAKEWATHIVKQSLTKAVRDTMTEEEQNALPILGNLKTGGSAPTQSDNNAAAGVTFSADGKDDLPF